MNVHQLEDQIGEAVRLSQEAAARLDEVRAVLDPYIGRFFLNLIHETKDSDVRRDYAYLNQTKSFEFVGTDTLRFSHASRNIKDFDVTLEQLLNP